MSQPPRALAFDMTYPPAEVRRFGPSLRSCWFAYAYCALAMAFVAFVLYGHVAPADSLARAYVASAANREAWPPSYFALLVSASGVAAVVRAHLRGVVLLPDGIETLESGTIGVPRVRRIGWAMIHALRLNEGKGKKAIGVDLWNGDFELLPEVADPGELAAALRRVAEVRSIPLSFGGRR
ncbi:MAG TPA: hypothetical protein VFS00_01440 [Polyangiaceae bacterium]|nr:hypothetical protein [Polyangiaceae bacterium]